MSKLSYKHRRMMVRELQRLTFIYRRDGHESMQEFAERGIDQYNSSLKSGYGKTYSDELRSSILTYLIVVKKLGDIAQLGERCLCTA